MPVCRRKPTQDRSREKYEQILSAAKQLIGERGNDAVSMREIAKSAGVAPSSIYQYFPDKNAILSAIMQGYFDQVQDMLTVVASQAESVEDLPDALNQGVDLFYTMFASEPVLATLWAGIQANTVLRDLDTRDSFEKAGLLADKLCNFLPSADRQEAFDAALLLVQMLGVTVRMALAMDGDRSDNNKGSERLLGEFKTLARLRINAFIQQTQ